MMNVNECHSRNGEFCVHVLDWTYSKVRLVHYFNAVCYPVSGDEGVTHSARTLHMHSMVIM